MSWPVVANRVVEGSSASFPKKSEPEEAPRATKERVRHSSKWPGLEVVGLLRHALWLAWPGATASISTGKEAVLPPALTRLRLPGLRHGRFHWHGGRSARLFAPVFLGALVDLVRRGARRSGLVDTVDFSGAGGGALAFSHWLRNRTTAFVVQLSADVSDVIDKSFTSLPLSMGARGSLF